MVVRCNSCWLTYTVSHWIAVEALNYSAHHLQISSHAGSSDMLRLGVRNVVGSVLVGSTSVGS
jgi:hypothetical protein